MLKDLIDKGRTKEDEQENAFWARYSELEKARSRGMLRVKKVQKS